VEVNLLSDLPYSIEVTLPNESLLHQQVVYETLPRFCKHCRTLGHITSTCTKSLPPIIPSNQQTPNLAPAPKNKDSIFHRLGPQVDNPVVDRSEANLPADCVPNTKQVAAELVSTNGAGAPNTGGWEIVQGRKVKRKPSPPRPSTVSPHVEPCPAQGTSHMPHRERQLSPTRFVPPITSTSASALAGFGTDKCKYMVVSGASGHPVSCSNGMPS
jgi:hypothetical protein